ncbi:hypothetical protein EK904_010304 [Melospiza melodia maxima]|nr:hypothetical protein EK904_010304 [Melospiza melodia maxima]
MEQYSGYGCQNCRDENRFGPDCQSECDCVHGECNSGVAGNGSCTCHGGYTGPRCDQGVTCEANSECVVRDGTALCDCKLGYRKQGSTCQAQDPCTPSPCSPFGVCKVLGPRTYECTCKEGFQGDGKICQPINPCVDNNGGCPENSTICVYRRPGEATCVCKPGMSRRPPSSECLAFPSDCRQYLCDVTATCEINAQGTPSCVCKEGEIGDGRNCYKDLLGEINQQNLRGRFIRKLNVAKKMFASGCSTLLTKYGPFTVFVPSLLPILDRMEFNDTTAEQLCKMHIVPGLHLIEDMIKAKTMWTLSGHQLTFTSQTYIKSFRYQDLPGELYNILQSNLPAANGIIHIVNSLRKKTSPDNLRNPQKTIGEILASMEIFSRFETILEVSKFVSAQEAENCGLPAILDGPGPFTVFVPSNDAVDKLRDGRLIYLFTEGINKLQELVKHHIYTSAAVAVEQLIMMPHIVTMANQILTINISADGRILMDESGIPLKMRDIVASNGIIHTLDGIFIPPSIVPILPHRCNEEQHKIVMGTCVDCEALNNSICPPGSKEMEPTLSPKECVYIHDPQGLNVLKKGCARYCNQTITCSDGIQGNGNCLCFEGFKGTACHICANPNKHGENCDEDCGCVHGVCDNRPGSGGVCQSWSCKEGYTGKFCDKTSRNCGPSGLSQYCHQHAVCSLNDTARCICMDGYEGDGFSCQPIDLCSQPGRGGCSQNALCTSTGPGTATCQCNVGWTGDGKVCVPIDNCMLESRGSCHLNADCIYTGPGQSKCVCKRGYAGDGYSCDAINPCLMDNGGCHDLASCVPLGGGERSCVCSEGYFGDGMTCYGDILKELARNSHFVGFYNWVKKSLFSIPAGTNVTVLVPSEAAIKNLSNADKDFWLTPYTLPFLVRAHFLEGVFTAEKLKKYGPELPTLNPQTRWQINTTSGVLTIQNATVVVSDIPASNGIIHVLSKVLLPSPADIPPSPPGLQEQLSTVPSFSTFQELLEEYQLIGKIESSEQYTIFVPGNNSIEEYCRAANVTQLDNETVQYHIILGEKLLPADLRSGVHKNSMLGLSYWLMFYQNSTQKFVNNIPLDGKSFETRNGILIGVSQVLQVQKNRCTANTTTIVRSRCGKCDKGIKCPAGSVLLTSVCCPGYYGHMCEMCPGKPGRWCSGNGECQDGLQGSGECRCLEGFHGTACEMCEVGRFGADCKSEIDPCTIDHGGCSVHAVCTKVSPGERTCACKEGYAGDGTLCMEIDLCLESNGGCHTHAECIKTGPKKVACNCLPGYSGDGVSHCNPINLCEQNNGGCSPFGLCKYTGPGTRNCTCPWYNIGDGFTCRGKMFQFEEWKSRGLLRELLRYHMVGCQKLLSSDLEGQQSLTSLSGHKIKITVNENSITLNEEATVLTSDIVGVNGVIHFINKILIPSDLVGHNISKLSQQNITEVAEAFGYSIYSKLLQDAELLPLLANPVHRPFTLLWPTDAAFSALPESRQKFLYRREHRDVLASYLKAHIIRDTKIVAGNMPQVEIVRSMRGSFISFSCSKAHVGEILLENGDATIIQRHMEFNGGIAYGIDRLLEPPDLGSRCDDFTLTELPGSTESCGLCGFEPPCPAGSVQRGETKRCYYYGNQLLRNTFLFHHNSLLRPAWPPHSPWDPFRRHFSSRGPLRRGCRRSCVSSLQVPQCCANHYGRDCRECNCTENGVCNGGLHGDGFCFCAEGWTGERCETRLVVTPTCSPPCHAQAACRAGNLCECDLHYEGDGRTCSVIHMCSQDNGGCARHAQCSQTGVNVSCACSPGYRGDGYICEPIDRCADGRNGDCSEHALCISTGPNERRCECKQGYVGDGIQCLEVAVPPTDRCLESNGQCHREAICTDLHFHDKTMGVFHLQSPRKKYGFTYEQAQAACAAEGASLATFQQLGAALQMGFHLCLVGWLDNGTAGYPTAYPNPSCGSGHVGIVDYGSRSNLSETWDAFCYREKDVTCSCRDGFVGDGYWCSGKLPDVLADQERFSTFYSVSNALLVLQEQPGREGAAGKGGVGVWAVCKMLLNFANDTEEGLDFFMYLSDVSAPKTLFAPLNSGFADNETLTGEELKLHVSSSNVILFSFNLTTGTIIPSQSGYDLHVSELPASNSTKHSDAKGLNDTMIVEWDIVAFNGIIHVIAEPLRIPPPLVHLGQHWPFHLTYS